VITYVDTSTLLTLIIDEDGSDRAATIWTSADAVASASPVLVERRADVADVAGLRGDDAAHLGAAALAVTVPVSAVVAGQR
jgi:hypothetical protein